MTRNALFYSGGMLVLAGVLASTSIVFQSPVLSLLCLTPLFLYQFERKKITLFQGSVFAFILAAILFFWMIQGVGRFTGSQTAYGLSAFLISCILFSVYWGSFVFLASSLHARFYHLSASVGASFVAALWVLGEEAFVLLTRQLPWFGFRTGFGLSSNLYAVQYASLAGMGAISFAVVFLSYYVARVVYDKKRARLLVPAFAFILFLFFGWLILQFHEQRMIRRHPVTIAIASQNIDPETVWNETTGNMLAAQIIRLSERAAASKPDITLWSESILPWTFREDDDLTKEIIKRADGREQLIGINTAYSENEVYNSVYYLNTQGVAAGFYHKRFPLAFIETPVANFIFPFLSGGGYKVKKGNLPGVIATAHGRVGMMICNESAIPKLATELVKNGADFLANVSNDGWFSETFLADAHMQQARLRAVETRRDMVVNSNQGYSGLIGASGRIKQRFKSQSPVVETVEIEKSNYLSFYARFRYFFPLTCITVLLLVFLKHSLHKKTFE
ncbi:MAG TPA: apolipoprotein N-acyltransferase [Flavisolibacter sp.]|nr:apolipoprotein N-acyltransferase [Flavisolibacter sp.]